MNLRIEGQTLRFRISKEELEALCSGVDLQQAIRLPGSRMEIRITPGQTGVPLRLFIENNRWHIEADKVAAQALLASLPNREGIRHQQDAGHGETLILMLEVDIRTQKRQRN